MMSPKWNFVDIHLLSPWMPHHKDMTIFLNRKKGSSKLLREHQAWRRRRLKFHICNCNQLSSSSPLEHDLFHNFISQLNSLDLLAPALGLASGVALYLSRPSSSPRNSSPLSDIGEWILFTTPTPFNRFVMLRCPSMIPLEEEEDANEKKKLVNRGRIQVRDSEVEVEVFVYQRICVSTDDGGVISLDWPANLELTKEHGLDTTIVIVPGNAQGSWDSNIRSFVCDCLKRGCFPVVINPRGCAGSPLTTPRLFTAADSDDICTAIHFINRARPWTTLMGVGWGYGANMLTKYLAEVGESTPLTAATCIDNPFDLEEAAGSSPYHLVEQNLIGGLIDILRSNEELFQGRAKGFNVEKALLARSVRDFEEAISMVSYGFDSIEDFYANSSTRYVVGNVKIPLLFIQNDDEAVPLNSIPRNLIVENPFTSLLLCSCPPFNMITSSRSAVSWCQNLVIEWLTAVELGLLKGRHPFLKDTDFTINPSKGLRLMENGASHKSSRMNNLLNPRQVDALSGRNQYPLKKMLKRSEATAYIYSSSGQKDSEVEHRESQNGAVKQTNLVNPELVKEGEVDPVDSDRGQGLQTTQVVLNMLDVTMPETLSEEQKNKVLTAVGQGEILMKALQDAVPEDVRGKLTNAVSAILDNKKSNLKFNALTSISQIPDVTSGLNTKIQEKVELSSPIGGNEDHHTSYPNKGVNDLAEDSNKNQPSRDDSSSGVESEPHTAENLQKPIDTSQFQSTSNHGGDTSNSGKKNADELGSNYGSADLSREKAAQSFEHNESDSGDKPDFYSRSERADSTEVLTSDHKVGQEHETAYSDIKEENDIQQKEEKDVDSSTDQNKMSSTRTEEKLAEKEGSEHQKREEISAQPVPNQSSSNSPTFSVSQALDALTGIDDSTQVAVNSVFSVIEDMITQLEGDRDDETVTSDSNKAEDKRTDTQSETHHAVNDEKKEDDENNVTAWPYESGNLHLHHPVDSKNDSGARWMGKKSLPNPILSEGDHVVDSQEQHSGHQIGEENEKWKPLVGSKLSAENTDKVTLLDNKWKNIQYSITKHPYGDPLYNQYLRNYLVSKMKNDESLDLEATTALFLDYIPEESQWKLLEQSGDGKNSVDDVKTGKDAHKPLYAEPTDNIIEPAYVILDAEKEWDPVEEYEKKNKMEEIVEIGDNTSGELMLLVKKNILDSLKVEVCRKVRATYMEEMAPDLAKELEHVASAITFDVVQGKEHIVLMEGEDLVKAGTLNGEHIIGVISSAVQETRYMSKVLPVGIIVGSSLAALRKFFNIVATDVIGQNEAFSDQANNPQERYRLQAGKMENDLIPLIEVHENNILSSSNERREEKYESESLKKDTVMAGAVTAALGASALLVHQQGSYNKGNEINGTSSTRSIEKANQQEPGKLEEAMSGKSEHNIVSSLAEKAMSVAGPVVPTKEDGEVDQERLVAMLADLGQKGGILKVVGKVALLWGGIRGAMSLTEKLISFLHIAERPLFQRILAFVCMMLVLWTPVVVPLLPTLVQNWATHNSSKIACIIGLYTSIMILLILWGKRIRGYEDPLARYGLDLTSSRQIQNFFNGLIGGVLLVLLIHSLNVLLGCACLSWPIAPSSADTLTLLKSYGKVLRFVGQGLVTATGVALVEELLFRSWLPDEIAEDLGYHRGVILSGLAFSLSQRSMGALPGLWLLSLGLAGARQRSQGSLSLPIGLRAGIMASSYVLQVGGFLTYQPNFPVWARGTHPFQPFSGVVGLSVALLWAVLLYPRQPLHMKKLTRPIKE